MLDSNAAVDSLAGGARIIAGGDCVAARFMERVSYRRQSASGS